MTALHSGLELCIFCYGENIRLGAPWSKAIMWSGQEWACKAQYSALERSQESQ